MKSFGNREWLNNENEPAISLIKLFCGWKGKPAQIVHGYFTISGDHFSTCFSDFSPIFALVDIFCITLREKQAKTNEMSFLEV